MGADNFVGADPVQRRLRRLSRAERIDEAVQFVREFARETALPDAARRRRETDVVRALRRDGQYDHTPDELAVGARLAWRNHARCIGRLWWKSLEVVDCRQITDPAHLAGHMFEHMKAAGGDGRIRSRISIFAPARPGQSPTTIESSQILQYAGYLMPEGAIVGDRKNIEFTRTVMSLGWVPPEPRGQFDLLPLLIRGEDGRRYIFDIPADIRIDVAITHPEHPALSDLQLRWYAVPCVSNMILTIGGIDYPCAPFNGHYMGTEIASRNLADTRRYDLLPAVAAAFGLDARKKADPLWRDRALTELNHAVLSSFRTAGFEMVDHHTASEQFMEFVKLEQKEGRFVSADWSWIVPPQASSACPVFHLPMNDRLAVPNFFVSRAIDGNALRPDRGRERRNRWMRRYDRLKRRWWDWRRTRDFLFQRN